MTCPRCGSSTKDERGLVPSIVNGARLTRCPDGWHTEKPKRVQLSRRKGWTLPPNTVVVARPTVFGNPFTVTTKMQPGTSIGAYNYVAVPTVEEAVASYRAMVDQILAEPQQEGTRGWELKRLLPELRGRNLACWCRLDRPCHADVLLEVANGGDCTLTAKQPDLQEEEPAEGGPDAVPAD